MPSMDDPISAYMIEALKEFATSVELMIHDEETLEAYFQRKLERLHQTPVTERNSWHLELMLGHYSAAYLVTRVADPHTITWQMEKEARTHYEHLRHKTGRELRAG